MTEKRTPGGLPLTPSTLLTEAMADLAKTEKMQAYVIEMNIWHSPREDGLRECAVCLAGAVMAQTMGVAASTTSSPHFHGTADAMLLYALDYARTGDWPAALMDIDNARRVVGLPGLGWSSAIIEKLVNLHVEPYRPDPGLFRRYMNDAIGILKQGGL